MTQLITIYKDEQLILEQVAQGQKTALEWVYKHCFTTVKKMVIKLGGNEDEAWDIFQDSVTIFYQKCSSESVSLSCRINTYITSIAKNLWLKRFATIAATHSPEEWEDVEDSHTDVDYFLQKEHNLHILEAAMAQLGDPCSKMLTAFYFHKKSMVEICAEFGYTNPETAKTQKYKCLTRLKKIFFTAAATVAPQEK